MRSIFFIFITYFIFWFRVGIFIFFLISMQHVITWPRCTFHSAILSLGYMEEELPTTCRAAADALEILSNLRPGFTRNVIPRINSSRAVSVSQANSGERQVNDEELQANEVPFNPRRRQPPAVLFKLGLPLSSRQLARTELVGKTLVEDQQSQSRPLSRLKAALPGHLFTRI